MMNPRRWNGWGDPAIDYPILDSARQYLTRLVGESLPPRDASLEQILSSIPPPTQPDLCHLFSSASPVDAQPLARLLHACGHSLPDWVAIRSGRIDCFPDAVVFPESEDQLQAILSVARKNQVHLIPYGGGTSVVGHINPLPAYSPNLTVDLRRLNSLLDLDETSRLACFGAGVSGPDLESQLSAKGYTLGHFPQSFEGSTLGGWVATRSSGQQSYHYGRIEDLFAGGRLWTFQGPLDLPALPASAAGPDLRQIVLGSEGRLGILSHAVVRIQPLPEVERFYSIFFPEWEAGMTAVRQIAQARLQVSMLRFSDAQETEITLALSGKDRLVAWARRGLGMLGFTDKTCLLIYGVTGDVNATSLAHAQVKSIARRQGGLSSGQIIGKTWRKSRFRTPYLRNTLWEAGYALDTFETALPWKDILPAKVAIQHELQNALVEMNERVLVFTHLSHVYPDGASIYTTCLFRCAIEPQATLERWHRLKAAACQAIVANGGTISHQHGVGLDHAPYLHFEKGTVGLAALEALRANLDPAGLLNPGKLLHVD